MVDYLHYAMSVYSHIRDPNKVSYHYQKFVIGETEAVNIAFSECLGTGTLLNRDHTVKMRERRQIASAL